MRSHWPYSFLLSSRFWYIPMFQWSLHTSQIRNSKTDPFYH